jgi:hypothetical protein
VEGDVEGGGREGADQRPRHGSRHPQGLVAGFPVVSHNGRYEIVPGLKIDEFSRQRIDRSVAELLEERDVVQSVANDVFSIVPGKFEDFRVDVHEWIDARDRLVVTGHFRGTAKSGH